MQLNLLAAAAAFTCGTLAAQTTTPPPPESVSTLDTVTITGARPLAPLGASEIDLSAPGTQRPAQDTASLLRDIPGMSLYGAGGVSSLPTLHGLADDRLRIQVDGMNLISACANHMNPPLSYVDPSNVGSIQVFSGIAPVSAGGDSIGGTIRVQSPEPEFAAAGQGSLQKGQAATFYRSNGNVKGLNLSATMATQTLSVSYSGATVEAGNYKAGGDFKPAATVTGTPRGTTTLAANEVGSSRYQSQNQTLGMALRNENHLLELKLGAQNIPYQGFPNQRMDMTSNTSEQINLRYKGQYQWGTLEARVYDEHTRHKMNFGDDKQFWYGTPATVPGMPMDTEGKNTGALVKADFELSGRDLLTVGGEYQRYRLNDWWAPSGGGMAPNTFLNINDGQRDRLDVFAEWEARWNPQWVTQLGARAATVQTNAGAVQGYNTTMAQYLAESTAFNARDRQRTDRNIDLSAQAHFTPDRSQTYEFGYAQKTRSPNLYERFAWSTGGMAMRMVNWAGDGNGYVGNLDLKPEVAHTLSATMDWHDADQTQWGLKITPYLTYVQDYIDARRCTSANTNCNAANQTATTGFVYLQFVNQSARLYGVDVSGYLPLAKTGDYGSFKFTGVLSYVNGKNEITGDNLYNTMPLNAKLALVQQVAKWTHTAEVQLVSAKTATSKVRNEMETAGYGLLHLRSSYAWKQARLDLGIENVLDRLYNDPLGGAYVGQGSTMGTAVPYGTPVPGMGRSLYAGVTVMF